MTLEEIQKNVDSFETSFWWILANIQEEKHFKENISELGEVKIVNNKSFYESYNILSFIRDVGVHFRMGPMLSWDSVQTWLNSEDGMTFTEFTYQLFQGYDFYHLYKEENCLVQVGG